MTDRFTYIRRLIKPAEYARLKTDEHRKYLEEHFPNGIMVCSVNGVIVTWEHPYEHHNA